MDSKYPGVTVRLSGDDANAFMMIGRTRAALRAHGVSVEEVEAFSEEAHAGDYDGVITTIMKWVNVE